MPAIVAAFCQRSSVEFGDSVEGEGEKIKGGEDGGQVSAVLILALDGLKVRFRSGIGNRDS